MHVLACLCVLTASITFSIVNGRSALAPETNVPEVKSNVIVLEVPFAGGDLDESKKVKVEDGRFFLEGKNFSSLDEMFKILKGQKEGRSSNLNVTTPEPYTLVVPVARNFSSLKELFEILNNDDNTNKVNLGSTNQTYVKGTETNSSDYTIFFASDSIS